MMNSALRAWIPTALAYLVMLTASAQAASVELTLGEPEPLPERLYSFNTNLLTATAFQGVTYGGPEFEDAVRDLRPRGLRFPGGTIANNYLWRTDSFSEQKDDKTGWAGEQLRLFRKMGRPYDLPGFTRVCKQFGVRPIWVLNVYEESPKSLGALLDHFDEIGLKVQAIEMGNEPYWDPRSFNNVQKYIAYCRPLAKTLRAKRPEIRIGACFGPLNRGFNYEEKWNAPLARETWYDAVVFHEYYGGQGFALDEGERLPARALLRPDALFDEPVEELSTLVPGKPIWFTEWNIGQKGLAQWKNTGGELLFLATAHTRLLEQRHAIQWACFHQFYDGKFGTFYYDKESGTIQTTASYELFRLLGMAFHEADAFLPLTSTDQDIVGFATAGRDGIRLFLVNRNNAPRDVCLPKGLAVDAKRLTIECPPETGLPISTPLAKAFELDEGEVVLPAHTVSLVASKSHLAVADQTDGGECLFPARPHLTLWYPPYARQQPRVDASGTYTLDLAKLADKPMAVVKMQLAGLDLKPGERYRLAFEARADRHIALIVKLPEPTEGSSAAPTPVGPPFRRFRFDFRYSPEENGGEISFFFTKEAIAKGPNVVLRKITLIAAP